MWELAYREAEAKAVRVLADGMGEGLVLLGEGGYYALYYFFPLYGRKAPDPEETPDWVEGPREAPEASAPPTTRPAGWKNTATLFSLTSPSRR